MYHYLGNSRLQMWFDSPNHCGAFLAMTTILSIGLFLLLKDKDNFKGKILLLGAVSVGIVIQEIGLALTYSRGGYVALVASIVFVLGMDRRKWAVFFLLSFLAVLLLTANGTDRIQSITATEDGSINHRLLLWEGGLALIWNNLWAGVGVESVGKLYTAWYQPLWLEEAYKTLINDYLTIAAAYGIFALLAYLTIVLTLFWSGLRLWRINKNPLLVAVLGGVVAYFTGALFTTFYCHWKVCSLFALVLVTLIAVGCRAVFLGQFRISFHNICIPCTCAFLVCMLVVLCGFYSDMHTSYHFEQITCKSPNGKSFVLSKAFPKAKSKAVLLHLFSSDSDTYEKAIRRMTRPLLAKDYTIFTLGVDSGMEGLARTQFALKTATDEARKNNQVLILVGEGDGGKHAIVAASKPESSEVRGVVAVGSPASWPFEEISPEAHIKGLKAPLLLVHAKEDETYPYTDSVRLKTLCDKYNIPVTLEIIEASEGNIRKQGNPAMHLLDKFISDLHGKDSIVLNSVTPQPL